MYTHTNKHTYTSYEVKRPPAKRFGMEAAAAGDGGCAGAGVFTLSPAVGKAVVAVDDAEDARCLGDCAGVGVEPKRPAPVNKEVNKRDMCGAR